MWILLVTLRYETFESFYFFIYFFFFTTFINFFICVLLAQESAEEEKVKITVSKKKKKKAKNKNKKRKVVHFNCCVTYNPLSISPPTLTTVLHFLIAEFGMFYRGQNQKV